ncbi:kinase-like domain, phloem protein 2-like protein [Tanacetum coccineum]
MSATNNFSETCRIGKGGYGTVYKAVLLICDGNNASPIDEVNKEELPNRHINTVAIKRIFDRVDNQGEHGFLSEIEMLSKCKHQNVVSLFGLCYEENEMVLIYEYVSNGSLEDYLGDNDKPVNLNWAQCMQISLDIAHRIKYLHTSTKDKPTIIHRDIKSANILLDNNWVAKIGDFGFSKLNNTNQQSRTLVTSTIAGTSLYLDPEYSSTGKLNKKSDVYSFGVVLFEIMCGTLKEMVDPNIIEADENNFMLYGGLNQDSLDTYSRIAYQCLEETQAKRPTMEVVIEELEKAILSQKNSKDNLHISLGDIKLATENFSDEKCIEKGRYWKQYDGEIPRADTSANHEHTSTVIVKRFDSMSEEGPQRFLTEIKVLVEFKHKNIVSLVGYCAEMGERIIVYEHALNGRLNKYVQDASLTWMQRINICIDVARGLAFLQRGGVTGEDDKAMIHGDIKSGSILLDAEWNAKISNLELASSKWKPEKWKHDEMFSGRFAWELEPLSFYKDKYGRCDPTDLINQVAFDGIKEQISANSCEKLFGVALYCGAYKGNRAVIEKLEEALQAQACILKLIQEFALII